MSITDERKKQVAFSLPYWKIKQVLVVKKDAKMTVDQVLANNNKVGVQRGTTEAKWIEDNLLKKQGKKFVLVQYDSAPLAIEDVVNGRIVAAAMDTPRPRTASDEKAVKILGSFGMQTKLSATPSQGRQGEPWEDQRSLKKLMASPALRGAEKKK